MKLEIHFMIKYHNKNNDSYIYFFLIKDTQYFNYLYYIDYDETQKIIKSSVIKIIIDEDDNIIFEIYKYDKSNYNFTKIQRLLKTATHI